MAFSSARTARLTALPYPRVTQLSPRYHRCMGNTVLDRLWYSRKSGKVGFRVEVPNDECTLRVIFHKCEACFNIMLEDTTKWV